MNEILLGILSVVISTIVLPLISIVGTYIVKWINSKIKNQEAAKFLSDATSIVINAVRTVTQTYVDSLKKSGTFDSNAQHEALEKAKSIALTQMSTEVKEFIYSNYGNIELWVVNQIEASINLIRNK